MTQALRAETSCLVECTTHSAEQQTKRRQCVAKLHAKIGGRYISLLDPLAGTGTDAESLSVDKAQTWVNDSDPDCVALLKQNFPNVTAYNLGLNPEKAFRPADLVYLDYNTYTLSKFSSRKRIFARRVSYRDTNDLAFATAQKFIILNDCTVHGLLLFPHTSCSSAERIMGRSIATVEDYFEALPDYYKKFYPAWDLTAFAQYKHFSPKGNGATAYLLFEKIS
jgi:hypothetical protein